MSELSSFLRQRLCCDHAERFDSIESPPWWQEGIPTEIDEVTYFHYLEILPPRYLRGSLFACAEGASSFCLFWRQEGHFFVLQLSENDTNEFCRLTNSVVHQ
jgi:hypothetical protein